MDLVCSDQSKEFLLSEQVLDWSETVMETAISSLISNEVSSLSYFVLEHRITPEQIAVKACVWRLLESIDLGVNVLDFDHLRGDTPMDAKVKIVDHAHERQGIKELHYQVISLLIILFQALVSKREILGQASALMVTSLQGDLLWVINL